MKSLQSKDRSNILKGLPSDLSLISKHLKVPKIKIVEFAYSLDSDEVAHDEPPHLDLGCFPSSL